MWCIASTMPLDPQAAARVAQCWASSRTLAPAPPRAVGTQAERSLAWRAASRVSCGKRPWTSPSAAWRAATSRATFRVLATSAPGAPSLSCTAVQSKAVAIHLPSPDRCRHNPPYARPHAMRRSPDRALACRHPGAVLSLYDTGLMVAQSLADAGIAGVGFDSDRRLAGFRCRRCRAVHCRSPQHAEDQVVQCLLRESPAEAPPAVLFPASDAFVRLIARRRDALAGRYLMNVPASGLVERIVSKAGQATLAAEAGLAQPRSAVARA